MATTGKYGCICGYPGISQQDLDEHCIAMARAGGPQSHAQARTR